MKLIQICIEQKAQSVTSDWLSSIIPSWYKTLYQGLIVMIMVAEGDHDQKISHEWCLNQSRVIQWLISIVSQVIDLSTTSDWFFWSW